MNLLKFSIGLTLFTSTFFAACKKDDDDDDGGSSGNACKVSQVQYFDSGRVEETGNYTYTGNQLTKVQFNDYYYTFEYTNNNISKRNYFVSAASTPEYYDQITYNSDGTVNRIEISAKTQTSSYAPFLRIDNTYSGGKLNKTTYLFIDGGVTEPIIESNYTYTGNNITTLNYTDYTDTSQGTINYTYDSNPNFFKKQNSQAFLVEQIFNIFLFSIEGFALLPMGISENNVTNISNSTISYEPDDKQNLKDLKIGGDLFARYTYQCP